MSLSDREKLVCETPPQGFKAVVEVVAAFVRSGDEFLFLHRLPHKSEGNAWGIPGGKVDLGETLGQAMIREMAEETGLVMRSNHLKKLKTVYIRYQVPKADFVYHMFEYHTETRPDIRINPNEHQNFRWLSLAESLDFNLIQGEEECIRMVYPELV